MLYLERETGSPSIALYDQRGKIATALYAIENGPALRLNGQDENPRVELGVRDGTAAIHILDAKGNLAWSTPTENLASPTLSSGGQRPRVFIEVWRLPGSSNATNPDWGDVFWRGKPTLMKESNDKTALMASFPTKVCPQPIVTIDQQKADYTFRFQEYAEVSENHLRTYSFGFQLFDSEGSQVGSLPEGSSLEDSLAAGCRAIMSDWTSKNRGGP